MNWGHQRTLEIWGFPDFSCCSKTPAAHITVPTQPAAAPCWGLCYPIQVPEVLAVRLHHAGHRGRPLPPREAAWVLQIRIAHRTQTSNSRAALSWGRPYPNCTHVCGESPSATVIPECLLRVTSYMWSIPKEQGEMRPRMV